MNSDVSFFPKANNASYISIYVERGSKKKKCRMRGAFQHSQANRQLLLSFFFFFVKLLRVAYPTNKIACTYIKVCAQLRLD
jgi:hypothetical protein